MPDASELHAACLRTSRSHGLHRGNREQIGLCTSQHQALRTDGVIKLPQQRFALFGSLTRQGTKGLRDGRVVGRADVDPYTRGPAALAVATPM